MAMVAKKVVLFVQSAKLRNIERAYQFKHNPAFWPFPNCNVKVDPWTTCSFTLSIADPRNIRYRASYLLPEP